MILRSLESASLAFENDESGLEERWLRQLLAPGSSMGGARPKATVMAVDHALWIAKFPSKQDEFNSGAWEKVIHGWRYQQQKNMVWLKRTRSRSSLISKQPSEASGKKRQKSMDCQEVRDNI